MKRTRIRFSLMVPTMRYLPAMTLSSASEDGALLDTADLLANDREFDGDALSVIAVSATSASGATLTLQGGQIVYDPGDLFDHLAAGEAAVDSFTYTVDDGKGGIDTRNRNG